MSRPVDSRKREHARYMLCEGERVEQVGVRRAEGGLVVDGSEVVWAIRALGGDGDAGHDARDLIAVDVGVLPDDFTVEVPLNGCLGGWQRVRR